MQTCQHRHLSFPISLLSPSLGNLQAEKAKICAVPSLQWDMLSPASDRPVGCYQNSEGKAPADKERLGPQAGGWAAPSRAVQGQVCPFSDTVKKGRLCYKPTRGNSWCSGSARDLGISQPPFIHPQCKHSSLNLQSRRNSGESKEQKTTITFNSKITPWSVLYLLIHTAFLGSLQFILWHKKAKKHPFLLDLNNFLVLCFILNKQLLNPISPSD